MERSGVDEEGEVHVSFASGVYHLVSWCLPGLAIDDWCVS